LTVTILRIPANGQSAAHARKRSRRRWIWLFVLFVAVHLAGCSTPPPVETYFAEFVPFALGGVSTDIVLPPALDTDALLGSGWAPWSEQEAGRGLWVHGHDAEFRFFPAVEGDLTLELQVQPFNPAGERSQVVTIALNGEVIDSLPLARSLETYEILLPGRFLKEGWNWVRMEFEQALRPSDFDEDSIDDRLFAARFRRILVRSPLSRPLWPGRPAAIELSNAGESLSDTSIEMPTDSVMDILVEPKAGQQLIGSVDMSLVERGQSTKIHSTIELLDEKGDSRVLFSTTFAEEPGSPATLHADLSEWADELVQIRVRSWGSANAIIRWHGLGLSAPAAEELETSTFATRAGDGQLLRRTNGGESEQPDIVLIMLDAARADAFLGADQPPSTPHIDALASESTHFTTAWAPSSWTGQSVPAVFTGHYPDAVGAEVWGSRLPKGIATLAELLASKGYFTALWSQHTIYRRNQGLQRGFEALQLAGGARKSKNLQLLPDADFLFVEDRPTFAMIHLLPPHDPYEPPAPFRGRLSSWYRGDFEPSWDNLYQLPNDLPTDKTVLEETIRYVRDRYRENVEFADHLVGRLVQTLEDAGRYENALIVILADHGESLFEHGRFLHRVQLYEESLRVPLFVKWPAYMSGFALQVEQPVILLDLAPTLIEGISVGGEQTPFHGRNLIPAAFDDFTYDRGLYAYTRGNGRAAEAAAPVYAYRSGRHKVLYSASLDILQLFDLQQDPGEERDLAATDLLRAKYLAQQAMRERGENLALLARSGPQPIEQLDPETIRALRALGYIQ